MLISDDQLSRKERIALLDDAYSKIESVSEIEKGIIESIYF